MVVTGALEVFERVVAGRRLSGLKRGRWLVLAGTTLRSMELLYPTANGSQAVVLPTWLRADSKHLILEASGPVTLAQRPSLVEAKIVDFEQGGFGRRFGWRSARNGHASRRRIGVDLGIPAHL
jgi:hypothetical protein